QHARYGFGVQPKSDRLLGDIPPALVSPAPVSPLGGLSPRISKNSQTLSPHRSPDEALRDPG
ncbi:MAG: hypothetical protein ACREYE_23425, partial [Gammaproteobacteria bacterium]